MAKALDKLAATSVIHLCNARKFRMAAQFMRTGEIRCECLVDEPHTVQGFALSPESLAAYTRAAHQCRRDLGECHAAMQSGDRENLRRSLSSFVSNSSGIGAALLP
ncbi:hypothetical protein VX159_05465 [Dechloromonas sp. ZY10]|uniref:hypothetical protein n=1 Tax=Dechloromonas aquae TaxID=2664436 RepID=UPI003526EB5B